MTAYLPVFACLGLWLVLGASLALLRRALAGPSPKPPSDPGDGGPDIDSGSPRPPLAPLALLAPALCGAVLLLALGAAGSGLAPSGAGALPVLLPVLAIALIHVARRGALPDAPETP